MCASKTWYLDLLGMISCSYRNSASEAWRPDVLLYGTNIHPGHFFMRNFLEPALTTTTCHFLLLFEVQGDSCQVIMSVPQGVCSMRKKALWSTENGEVKLTAQSGSIDLDKSLGSKGPRHFCVWGLLEMGWRCHRCLFLTHEDTDM